MPATAFDTETELIAPGNQAPHLICLTWTDQYGDAQIIHWKHAFEIARELIANASAENPLVGHNAAFDLCVLARQYPDLMPTIFEAYQRDAILDTAVAEKLIDIARGFERSTQKGSYTLASLADRYLGLTLDKDTWRMRYGELKEARLDEWPLGAKDYALLDAKTVLEIFKIQQRQLSPDLPAQCRADFALRLASNRGVITCPVAVSKFSAQVRDEYESVKAKLLQGGLLRTQTRLGEKTFVRNTKKAQERLGEILGTNVERTPSGLVQVDEDSCIASKDGLLLAYNRFTKLQTLTTKDCAILQRGTEAPIHTYFNVLVNTGRASSRNPNMQNPRREPGVRECFVPRDGFVFASADYEAAELHTLGQVCISWFGFSTLADQLNQGIDPHLSFAARLLYIDYEEAVARKRAGDNKVLETRQMAKAANFGFPGGMGAKTFRAYAKGYGFDLSFQLASDLRKRWLASFPEMEKYFARISDLCRNSQLADLRHLFSKRVRGRVHFTAACNSFFQGLAADGAKRALFEVQRHCQARPESSLFGSHVVNFLHDEIMLEVPEGRGHDAAHELAEIMVREFNHFVPNVPVKASPQLMRCWSKNAKSVYDASGRLIPWKPKEVQ
jgi:DNA polymerase-1